MVRSPHPAADGPSRDWVNYWPPRLVKSREVSYLVYYTDEGDDPPENPLVDSSHQERFRRFIESLWRPPASTSCTATTRHGPGSTRSRSCLRGPRITFRRGTRRMTVRGPGIPVQLARDPLLPPGQPGNVQGRQGRLLHAPGSWRPTTCSAGTGWWRPTTSATTRRPSASSRTCATGEPAGGLGGGKAAEPPPAPAPVAARGPLSVDARHAQGRAGRDPSCR